MTVRGRSKWLADTINSRGYTRGAEIGVAIGLTTGHILRSCSKVQEYIVADDWRPVPGSGIFAANNMRATFNSQFGTNKKVTVLEGLSWDQAKNVTDGSLDFCFIDAGHDYDSVIQDLKAWAPKVRPGGILCGHDIHWDGVKEAVKELYPDYDLAGVDNVWYRFMKL